MTNQEIYTAALRLACEAVDDAPPDYADRAESLLAVVGLRYAALDAAYREATGAEAQVLPDGMSWDLDDDFPLSSVFAPPAATALASMLVMEENPELSDRLNTMTLATINSIRQSTPFHPEPIMEKYL